MIKFMMSSRTNAGEVYLQFFFSRIIKTRYVTHLPNVGSEESFTSPDIGTR